MNGVAAKLLSQFGGGSGGGGSTVPESRRLDLEQKLFVVVTAWLATRTVLSLGPPFARAAFVLLFAGFVAATLFLQSSCTHPKSQDEMTTIRVAAGKRALVILGLHMVTGVFPPLIMSNVVTLLGILESGAFAEYLGETGG